MNSKPKIPTDDPAGNRAPRPDPRGYTTKEAAAKLGASPVGLSMVRRHFTAYTTQVPGRATYWDRALVDSAYECKRQMALGLRRSLEEAAKEVPRKGKP